MVQLESWLPVLHHVLADGAARGLKSIVFCQAAQQTRLLAFLLARAPAVGAVFEIHSRLSQSQRVRQLEAFKVRAERLEGGADGWAGRSIGEAACCAAATWEREDGTLTEWTWWCR